jgi:exodeoxyribonuclease VII large subunit
VLTDRARHIAQAESLLTALDPKNILRRGYSLVRGQHGQLIRGAHDVKLGETLTITTAHAIIQAGVIDAKQK